VSPRWPTDGPLQREFGDYTHPTGEGIAKVANQLLILIGKDPQSMKAGSPWSNTLDCKVDQHALSAAGGPTVSTCWVS